jgi:MFS family permease
VGALFYTSLTVFAEFWGIQYLIQAHKCTSMQAAQAVSMVFFGWAVGSPISGWISDRLKRRITPMVIGSIFSFIAISIVIFSNNLPLYLIYAALFVYGLSCSVQVVVFALGKEHSSLSLTGSAVAITNMLVMLSGMVLQPFLGWLLDFKWSGNMLNNIPYYGVVEYRFALSILPIGMILAFILLFFIKETYAKTQEVE